MLVVTCKVVTLTNDLDNFDKLNAIKCRLIALKLGSQIIILVMVWNQGLVGQVNSKWQQSVSRWQER